MRTPWEQAREEAFNSAVKRGESRLLGEEAAQTAEDPGAATSPTLVANAAALAAEVAAKVKELAPSADAQAITKAAMDRALAVLQNAVLAPRTPLPTISATGLSATTKKYLVIGAGVLAGVGLLWFLKRKKQS